MQEWSYLSNKLKSLTLLAIPRFISPSERLVLAGFGDASKAGYGCAIYISSQYSDGMATSHLIRAKSKVAGLKPMSMPRMELQAALLLAKVVNEIIHKTNMSPSETVLFSDSQVVLCWLKIHPSRLKEYVVNRLNHIQD